MSIGYGMGHHAAAGAVAEELERRGCIVRCVDPCELASPAIFAATQRFYSFCVRRAPWLWGITYEQTDNSDWGSMLWMPGLAASLRKIRSLLDEYRPDACICTYPLFAHMLDAINAERCHKVPYALVVTDALEISRPWATSLAPLICVPDTASRELLMGRYGISPERIVATGFPVRRSFAQITPRSLPSARNLRILYGAYAPLRQVRGDVRTLLGAYPQAEMTLVAGGRLRALKHLLREFPGRLQMFGRIRDLQPFFAGAHIYIGKAGAATLFEAYASGLPVIVNYALPGQEQGNLELLLTDRCGMYAGSPGSLLQAVGTLLESGAALWQGCVASMRAANRACGAENVADEMERRFL